MTEVHEKSKLFTPAVIAFLYGFTILMGLLPSAFIFFAYGLDLSEMGSLKSNLVYLFLAVYGLAVVVSGVLMVSVKRRRIGAWLGLITHIIGLVPCGLAVFWAIKGVGSFAFYLFWLAVPAVLIWSSLLIIRSGELRRLT